MSKAAAFAKLALSGLEPRGLSREQAAAYVGVSPNKFDTMVTDGRMPKAKCVDGRRIWDRRQLDRSFSALPDDSGMPGDEDDIWGRLS